MLDQIVEELPRFFGYYNLLFFAKALGTTFALSAIGCVIGFTLGFWRRAASWPRSSCAPGRWRFRSCSASRP